MATSIQNIRSGVDHNFAKQQHAVPIPTLSGSLGKLVGHSPAMQAVFEIIRCVAPTDACVLIVGESGTGKELAARAIHSLSARRMRPFIAVNCAAIPETLVESEMFGHERGAFTGAFERRNGIMERAQGGTLFLDEVGEMPLAIQAKLLRVLEDFRFRRLGGKTELTADVRVISATNRNPEIAMQDGTIREDFYYRLNVFPLELPPLRDHMEDLIPIIETMIDKLNRRYGTRITGLEPEAVLALNNHYWPGNVRELRNAMERAMILANTGTLLKRHFQLSPHSPKGNSHFADSLPIHAGTTIARAEKVLIEATMAQSHANNSQVAAILGISTRTLHSRLVQYRLLDAPADSARWDHRARHIAS